jgi:phosphatidylserine/phosphatidylglycerophosphate/cardiolipin synthase-like enzyme
MHHKFLVVDRQWVITGSANWTLSDIHGDVDTSESRGNANALLKINSSTLASHFTEEFNQMWGDGPGAATDSRFGLKKRVHWVQRLPMSTGSLTLQFSPLSPTQPWENSVNGLIRRTLSQATHSIDLALFVFSEQPIANQLEMQSQKGTQLRVLIDPGFVYRNYSEALDMMGIVLPDQRCQIEDNNRPWKRPIDTVGSPRLLPGDKLHHKFAVIDNRTVIIGSHNWSDAANTQNDETLLVIENTTVSAHFKREFERLYRSPFIGNTAKLQQKREQSYQRCQFSSSS